MESIFRSPLYPLRIKRVGDSFLPIIGITKINDDNWKLPSRSGSIEIKSDIAFKIINIDEDPKSFEMIIKIRQIGTNVGDGYFAERNTFPKTQLAVFPLQFLSEY